MVVTVVLCVLGVISLGYFAGYVAWIGINNSFTYLWALLGIVCIAWGIFRQVPWVETNCYIKRAERVVGGLAVLLLLIFGITLGIIVPEGKKTPKDHAEYIILLGAHVYGERMSSNLSYRVKAGLAYLQKNPETKAILSGGCGKGESITEAQAMKRYLMEKGIAQDRLLLEESSTNTEENIENSGKQMKSIHSSCVIVTNNFHVYRAKEIAKKLGFTHVEGLGSVTHAYTAVNCYTREVIAVIKYKLSGQI